MPASPAAIRPRPLANRRPAEMVDTYGDSLFGSLWRDMWNGTASAVSRCGGAVLLGLGVASIFALISFHPADPSWDTVGSTLTSGHIKIHNWLGTFGATLADALWQWLGCAAVLVVPWCLFWGWRSLFGKTLSWKRLRGVAALLALSGFAAASTVWFNSVGVGVTGRPGGVIGAALAARCAEILPDPLVSVVVGGVLPLASLALMWVALGLRRSDWELVSERAGDGVLSGVDIVTGLVMWTRGTLGSSLGGSLSSSWQSRRGMEHPALRAPSVNPLEAGALGNPDDEEEEIEEEETEDDYEVEDSEEEESEDEEEEEVVVRPRARKAAPRRRRANGDGPLVPPTDLLQDSPGTTKVTQQSQEQLRQNAQNLESSLQEFGVQGQITGVNPGPVVTLYELEPAPGTRAARVIGLSDDIARQMCARAVRVAVVPGRNAIGIELPNTKRETVYLRELLEDDSYAESTATLPLSLGKDIGGTPIVADLARMPHLLVAGTTGSGKSVAINAMILSLLYRLPPEKCRLIMIDPKMLELSVYEGIPHLLTPVVTEPKKAILALKWAVREMEERYRSMSKLGVRNVDSYNQRLAEARENGEVLMRRVQTGFDGDTGKPVFEDQPLDLTELPYIVIIVDEMADLMMVAGKDIEVVIQRLAQMARAAGLHLIMATQRPSVDVITGTIKANFPTRISFQVTSKIDSRTILNEQGAEQLLGQGDMLYMAGGGRISRVHGPFVRDDEVESVVKYLKERGEPVYIDAVTEDESEFGEGGGDGEGTGDDMYDKAVALVAREGKASTSFIQRHLQIGYNRAARIMDQMEAEGVVSRANHVGKREVLVGSH